MDQKSEVWRLGDFYSYNEFRLIEAENVSGQYENLLLVFDISPLAWNGIIRQQIQ